VLHCNRRCRLQDRSQLKEVLANLFLKEKEALTNSMQNESLWRRVHPELQDAVGCPESLETQAIRQKPSLIDHPKTGQA